MKKYLIVILSLVAIYFVYDTLVYNFGIYIDFHPNKEVTTFMSVDKKDIYIEKDGNKKIFEIKGVDMGSGIPGHFSTDYAIDKDTYMRWFKYIQEMGANTIRVYTILNSDFYNAFYEYNKDNSNPLYLIHGLWLNDYVLNSHLDAYSSDFLGALLDDSKTLVDIIHGKKHVYLGSGIGAGYYNKDISDWVIGYIVGVEWDAYTVSYTDHHSADKDNYQGKYMFTTDDATPFEAMLAQVGDKLIEYESKKYKDQRLVAFSNWATTDPFEYSEYTTSVFNKFAKIDVEHIKTSDKFKSGTFASYHIYPYYPDYLSYYDPSGEIPEVKSENTYLDYLKMINEHHTIPVVVSEFGVPSSRGKTYLDSNTGRDQGGLSEQEQGRAIIDSYNDILTAGIKNAIIFTWQDEWFKRTWNTMHADDLTKTPYWSDYQTNEQYFGLLSFDPGKDRSVSYVDGDTEEWTDKDIVTSNDGYNLSMKYDEKFIYFRVNKKNYKNEKLYIPIDVTPNSGTKSMKDTDLKFNRDTDFVIVIDGEDNSRVLVQEYYDTAKAVLGYELRGENSYIDIPKKDSSTFNQILMLNEVYNQQRMINGFSNNIPINIEDLSYETGKLTYGNANPDSDDFNSLADFIINGDDIEIKIPWGLLNFSDPSNMNIHDDYYEHYGVENKMIDRIYVGIGSSSIELEEYKLKGWRKNVTYHERLKKSYYMVRELWNK